MIRIRSFSLLLLVLSVQLVCGDSWTSRVLAIQRTVSSKVPIDQVPIPQTHNSYNTEASGVYYSVNQKLSIPQQLSLGIRGLEVDVHYITNLTNPTRVCHGSQDLRNTCQDLGWDKCGFFGIVDYGDSTGCKSTALTFDDILAQISAWLVANPNEVIIVWIEHDGYIPADEFNGAVSRRLGNSVYTPFDKSNSGANASWPSAAELVAMNKRIILLAEGDGEIVGIYAHLGVQWPGYPAKKIMYFQPNNCSSSHPDALPYTDASRSFGLFYDDESLFLNPLNASAPIYNGTAQTGKITPENIVQLGRCGLSAAIDMINETRMSAFVWSFAQDRPYQTNYSLNCAVWVAGKGSIESTTYGRWIDGDCTATLPFACKTSDGEWIISEVQDTWFNSTDACPGGSTFDVPRTAYDQYLLSVLAHSLQVDRMWLLLSDLEQESVWSDKVLTSQPTVTQEPPSTVSQDTSYETETTSGYSDSTSATRNTQQTSQTTTGQSTTGPQTVTDDEDSSAYSLTAVKMISAVALLYSCL